MTSQIRSCHRRPLESSYTHPPRCVMKAFTTAEVDVSRCQPAGLGDAVGPAVSRAPTRAHRDPTQ